MIEPGGGDPVRVLLVDDEQNVLKALRRLLMDEDWEVLTANSGREGLDLLQEVANVGVIVSDQKMPEMTGVEFLARARKAAPYAMKIMLTGYADINATVDAINKGHAHRFMTKPWNDEELLEVIRSAVNTYRMILENVRAEEEQKAERERLRTLCSEQKRRIEALEGEVKARRLGPLLAVVGLLESREGVEAGHARSVAELSEELAREMGLSGEEVERIGLAARLHDVGKIGMSDIALMKDPVDMNEEERDDYRLHPIRGERVVEAMGDAGKEVGRIIRHHHEAYDGSGFPDRLKGEEIPLGSRIVALADYVARARAVSRKEEDAGRVLLQVEGEMGKRFDPALHPYLGFVLGRRDEGERQGRATRVRELFPSDLEVGMIVAQDIRAASGVLLLRRGTMIDRAKLEALRQFYRQGASNRGIFVYASMEGRG